MKLELTKDALTVFLEGNRNDLKDNLDTVCRHTIKHCVDYTKKPSREETEALDTMRLALPKLCRRVLRDKMTVDAFVDMIVKTADAYSGMWVFRGV